MSAKREKTAPRDITRKGAIDFTHAARSDFRANFVTTEF
jgi:hypothetical protein